MSLEKIERLRSEIDALRKQLQEKEELLRYEEQCLRVKEIQNSSMYSRDFYPDEISRYSRQLLLPSIGIRGQLKLKKGHILIVGVGGLGCPAAQYLAAAGVGKIDILDSDVVDLTNLHRQVLHGENDIGKLKVQSGFERLKRINSSVEITPLEIHASSDSLQELFSSKQYDVVVDGTDNVATRYLLNDMCVINNIPLVSGSALQFEGQLTVYNYKGSLCYRCLFPVPPPPETVTSCGDGGVLGPIPGVIGVLQALEVIKILLDLPGDLAGRLLIFDGSDTIFRTIKLRQKNPKCAVCGENPTVTKPIDYEQFCGAKSHDKVIDIKILDQGEEIDVNKFSSIENKTVIDVRPETEFEMCSIPNSINFPCNDITSGKNDDYLQKILNDVCSRNENKVYVLCRRGNDSQRAVSILKEKFKGFSIQFLNVIGGLHAYNKFIDSSFPLY